MRIQVPVPTGYAGSTICSFNGRPFPKTDCSTQYSIREEQQQQRARLPTPERDAQLQAQIAALRGQLSTANVGHPSRARTPEKETQANRLHMNTTRGHDRAVRPWNSGIDEAKLSKAGLKIPRSPRTRRSEATVAPVAAKLLILSLRRLKMCEHLDNATRSAPCSARSTSGLSLCANKRWSTAPIDAFRLIFGHRVGFKVSEALSIPDENQHHLHSLSNTQGEALCK